MSLLYSKSNRKSFDLRYQVFFYDLINKIQRRLLQVINRRKLITARSKFLEYQLYNEGDYLGDFLTVTPKELGKQKVFL